MNIDRRGFLALLAALPAMGAVGGAVASMAGEGKAALVPTRLFLDGVEYTLRALTVHTEPVDMLDVSSIYDDARSYHGITEPKPPRVEVELAGVQRVPFERVPFEIRASAYTVTGTMEVDGSTYALSERYNKQTERWERVTLFDATLVGEYVLEFEPAQGQG